MIKPFKHVSDKSSINLLYLLTFIANYDFSAR